MRRICTPTLRSTPQAIRRSLYVHEYHAKDLLKKFGVDHQRGYVVKSAEECAAATAKVKTDFQTENYIVKAQILAGGRGKGSFVSGKKGGGVKFAKSAEDVEAGVVNMLGERLVTAQTGSDGMPVDNVYIAECLDIQREFYFAFVLEGKSGGYVMVGSAEGGVEIEEVSKNNPDAICTDPVDFNTGLGMDQARAFAKKMGFGEKYIEPAAVNMVRMYDLAKASDATQVEINPFIETPDGRVVCIDAKINFDDNADFRQKDIFALRDPTQENQAEIDAGKYNMAYIALEGDIACMVNGAGLAMSTMDIVQQNGSSPANFLDLGGGVSEAGVTAAFKIITADPQMKGILVNIFGGIVMCDTIAKGIIAAAKTVKIEVPMVVRLSGSNEVEGREIIANSGLPLVTATDMDDAAQKITALVNKNKA